MLNKILSKIANDNKLSIGVVAAGVGLSVISNVIIFAGVYYTGLHKGVELRDDYYYNEEVKAYEENIQKECN